ncbi:hypothetical protein [Nitrosopumilus cobalaminigenes]|nr:hypothetical protein [Nitrosopumilus cobalaminigenes]
MTRTSLLAILIAATIAITITPQIMAQEENTDVSVWDSTVIPVFGIYSVGGSGQIAGNFAVDTFEKKDTAIQVGLRAQDRFDGPIEPIGNVYFAPTGESAPGIANWNFDWSADAGTTYLQEQLGKDLTSQDLEDYTVILEIVDTEGNTYSLDFLDIPYPPGPVLLSQSSQNVGFGFIGLPIDSAAYDISLSVSNDKGRTLAESEITVIVTDETPDNGKIDICHKGKKTINVSVNSVTAHLNHGDTVGAC